MKKPQPQAHKRKKPEFKIGELVNLPVRILKVDRRWRPERYMIQSCGAGWILEDMVDSDELRPLNATEAGPRRKE